MARRVTWGTPGRSPHYVVPRPAFALVYPALLLAALVIGVLLLAHAAGLHSPVSPGNLTSPHSLMDTRCQECHAPQGRGVVNGRCQRCHDPSGAGRLTNGAHVLFGSRDPKKASQAPNRSCASCHVEHRGRSERLASVGETHCFECHFKSYAVHPEFAVLRARSREAPGLKFGHEVHVKAVMKQTGAAALATCTQCHEPTPAARDFDPVSFDRQCASCHAKEGSLGSVDPIRQDDVLGPEAILAAGVRGAWLQRTEEYDVSRGRIAKTAVRHRDEWVLYNMRKLRREVDPEGYEAERGALLARMSQLRRRLALAAPLAGLGTEALKAREAALEMEVRGVEKRLEAQSAAQHPMAGLSRLAEVLGAASAARDPAAVAEARALEARGEPFRQAGFPPTALSPEDFEARRHELLAVIEAIEAADPALKWRAEDLRRRLLSLEPGESAVEILKRVGEQRAAELQRVRDEIGLRGSGGPPPPPAVVLTARQREIRKALEETAAQLQVISAAQPAKASLTPEERERKQQALEVLTAACAKCHLVKDGVLARVAAARRVLVRSVFVHQPHLLHADCARCHADVDKSKLSSDLNFKGVESCRECHRSRGARTDCQLCHRYHPPGVP